MTPRQRADLEIAAARSAVAVWERCWNNIPDGAGTLERARANLAAVERRYADLVETPARPPVTAPWVGPEPLDLAHAPPDQPCHICQKPNSQFGFGLAPSPTTWACLGHRAIVEALWKPEAVQPMPRTKKNPRRQ